MAGWDKGRVLAFKRKFQLFANVLRIDSKETGGRSPLNLYNAQKRFLTGIFDGLESDIHSFVCLKSRQLGITTVSLALDLFWVGTFEGLQGALVFDTDSNRKKARILLKRYMASLPKELGFPRMVGGQDNRDGVVFENGSTLDYLAAGIKKSTAAGGLARSRAYNFIHATECSSWADEEGVKSLKTTMAKDFENRLYIWESTARGFNIFHDMWLDAKADDLTQRAIFIGWWAKETQVFLEGSPLFERYGVEPPSEEEAAKIARVKELYDFDVTMEQLAWMRHERDPRMEEDLRSSNDYVRSELLLQEQPWTEDEAFLQSGSSFFPGEKLTEAMKEASSAKFTGYQYTFANNFLATMLNKAQSAKKATLRIWEDPDPIGTYVIGADPAYGSSDEGDRYVAQVLRCYADGVDQVAEFCTTVMTTEEFSWVLAHLCGAYADARLLLELNGPGNAVWQGFKTLKQLMQVGYLHDDAEARGLLKIFDNVRVFLWSRGDSLNQSPTAFHWETTTKKKVELMERFRDFFQFSQIRIRSMEALNEMKNIVRDGDSIKGEGTKKDDRVMGLALALRAWEQHERKPLINQKRTRENEARRRTITSTDLYKMFMQDKITGFFNQQQRGRVSARRAARRGSRWNWTWLLPVPFLVQIAAISSNGCS
jgi:hypothetical protein